jgi:hypothetical protein
MTITTILKNKSDNKSKLLNSYNLSDIKKALGLIVLANNLIDDITLKALEILPANFIIISDDVIENR